MSRFRCFQFWETIEEAKQSLQEALEAFFEECEVMGTLTEVLEESGFVQRDGNWLPRQPIASELENLRICEYRINEIIRERESTRQTTG